MASGSWSVGPSSSDYRYNVGDSGESKSSSKGGGGSSWQSDPWAQTEEGVRYGEMEAGNRARGNNAAQIYAAQIAHPWELTGMAWTGALQQQQRAKEAWAMLKGEFGGGTPGKQPQISVGPVWNPQQIQAQTNAARGSIDAQTATNMGKAASSAAGRGFGSASPLVQALQGQMMGQGMATKAEAARQIPWEAAMGNAKNLMAGQALRETQFASREDEAIRRRNALLQALSGVI